MSNYRNILQVKHP